MKDTKNLLKPHMIAFIDIMGTKDIVLDSQKSYKKLQLLDVLLNIHDEIRQEGNLEQLENGVRYKAEITSFSDCIAISVPLSNSFQGGAIWDSALISIQKHVSQLFSIALEKGFLVRGAIEIGELYHANHMIFGEALVKAYLQEQKATYPRIVLTDNCLARRNDYSYIPPPLMSQQYISNLKILDYDSELDSQDAMLHTYANLFMDYDGTICLRMVNVQEFQNRKNPLESFGQSIRNGINDCCDDSNLKKNWIWLERYIEKEELSWKYFKTLFPSNS